MKRIRLLAGAAACSVTALLGGCVEEAQPDLPDARPEMEPAQQEAIEDALPDGPVVPPRQPRSLLIFSLSKGFAHESIPWVDFAVARMGEKSGAFRAVVSRDTTLFRAERLAEFDAVLFNNNTGEPFSDPDLRAGLLAFVREGGGVIGLHAATDGFHEWSEFGEMMGGYFVNHPWNEEVTLKIEDPGHPITAPFSTAGYVVADEIYQFREPYSRDRLRVLISLDTVDLDLEREGVQREDRDFAVSWIREEGEGRVFYSSLGHRFEIFTDPTILLHWLAGIQYALGDLEADATPTGERR
jgi:type 1 glutamine amidotransferase